MDESVVDDRLRNAARSLAGEALTSRDVELAIDASPRVAAAKGVGGRAAFLVLFVAVVGFAALRLGLDSASVPSGATKVGDYAIKVTVTSNTIVVSKVEKSASTPLLSIPFVGKFAVRQLVCPPVTADHVVIFGATRPDASLVSAVKIDGLGQGSFAQGVDGSFLFVSAGFPLPGNEWTAAAAGERDVTGHVAGSGTRLMSPEVTSFCLAFDPALENARSSP